jgi:hypothetical protein
MVLYSFRIIVEDAVKTVSMFCGVKTSSSFPAAKTSESFEKTLNL